MGLKICNFRVSALQGHKRASRFLAGATTSTGTDARRQRKNGGKGQCLKSINKSNPPCVSGTLQKVGALVGISIETMKKGHHNPTQTSVINSFESAKIRFSAQNIFIANHIEEQTNKEKEYAFDTLRLPQYLHPACLATVNCSEKQKHAAFATKLQSNWYLSRQKVLWINYDEKWFYGWVS